VSPCLPLLLTDTVSILHSLDEAAFQNAWLTIGVFDGVHRGHQQILDSLSSQAHAAGEPALVLTFEPHPAVVLGGRSDYTCLTTLGERTDLLEASGADVVIIQTFTREFADQTARQFMRRVVQRTGLHELVIGYDTALGRGRQGNAARLAKLGKEMSYVLQVVPPLKDEIGIISSTRIRQAIASGRVSDAARDLGRLFSITGPVVHGDGRGHRINLPTANMDVPSGKVTPANGIYACWAWVEGHRYQAATNVGVRPTFTPDLPAPLIEAHLLDFEQDLYGQQVTLEFVEYLRPEEKYASVEALVAQIHMDITRTRHILEAMD